MVPLKKLTLKIAGRVIRTQFTARSVSDTVYKLSDAAGAFQGLLQRAEARRISRQERENIATAEWVNGMKIQVAIGEPPDFTIVEALRGAIYEESRRPIAARGAMARLILKTCALSADEDAAFAPLTDAVCLDHVRRALLEAFPDRADELVARVENWAVEAGAMDETDWQAEAGLRAHEVVS